MSQTGLETKPRSRRVRRRALQTLATITIAAAAGLLALPPVGAKSIDIRAFLGSDGKVRGSDLAHSPSKAGEFTESWVYFGWTKTGLSVQVRFSVTNIGPGSNNLIVEARVATPDGESHEGHENFDKKSWSADESGLHLEGGASHVRVGPRSHDIHVVAGGIEVDLKLRNVLPAWRPGDGHVWFGDPAEPKTRKYRLDVMSPRALVTGTVHVTGRSYDLKGIGYAQHTRADIASYKMASTWDRFQGFTPTHTVLYGRFVTPKRYGDQDVGWLLLARGREIVLSRVGFELKRFDPRLDSATRYGFEPPWAWTVKAEGEDYRLTGTITARSMRSVHDFLERMHPIERAVVRMFAKPVEYDQSCSFAFTFKREGEPAETIAGSTDGCGSTFF